MLRSSKGLLVANSPAEQALRLMVGKAWRLARTRRRRAAWAAEAVSVVWLAAVIAPATGGAKWLTSPMMVLRQALAPCFQEPLRFCPCHFRTAWIHADPSRRVYAEGRCAHTHIKVAVRGSKRPRIGRGRGLDGVLSECARGLSPPLTVALGISSAMAR